MRYWHLKETHADPSNEFVSQEDGLSLDNEGVKHNVEVKAGSPPAQQGLLVAHVVQDLDWPCQRVQTLMHEHVHAI